MFRFIFICTLLISGIPLSAQSYILAGQTQGLIYTDYDPDQQIAFPPSGPGTGSHYADFYVDIDHDGQDDFVVNRYNSTNLGGGSSLESITGLNGNQVYATVSRYIFGLIGGSPPDTSVQIVAKRFSLGDTLINFADTLWRSSSNLFRNYYLANTSGYVVDTTNPGQYFLVRIVSVTDTLLGYIHVTNGGLLYDMACQGNSAQYVIASLFDEDITMPCVYPTFFSDKLFFSEKSNYWLLDDLGRMIERGNAANEVNTASISSGIYFLKLQIGNTSAIYKVIKVR